MKSLKSIFALFAIVTLSFGCASVTDASLSEEISDQPDIETTTTTEGVFGTGHDMDPVVKPPE